MKIIAIDSSSLVASVAILEDDTLIAEYNVNHKKTHSQTLLPMLDELKNMVELDLTTIDAICVSKGPGSFTGLRIGSATAKGLAQGLDIPIIEIGTLEGMACNLYGTDAYVCPMMDARRGQVYAGLYSYASSDNGFKLLSDIEECAIAADELLDQVYKLAVDNDKRVIFLGDGTPVHEELIKAKMADRYIFAPAYMNRQRAAAFGLLAMDRLVRGEVVDCYSHTPDYLRLSQAERERNEGITHKGSNYSSSND